MLCHLDSRLLNPLRNGFAAGEEHCAEHHIRGETIPSGASHRVNGHHLRSFEPDAIASSSYRSRNQLMNCIAAAGSLESSPTCSKLRFMHVAWAKWETSWNWIDSSWRSPACVTS